MSRVKLASFGIFTALALITIFYHLGPALLAGLFSYMILDLAQRRFLPHMPPTAAKACSLIMFVVISLGLGFMFWVFMRLALARVPLILTSALPVIDRIATAYGIDLPFDNLQEFRAVILGHVREHAHGITRASGLLTRDFFQIIIAMFIAALYFLAECEPASHKNNLYEELTGELGQRVSIFMSGFEKILSAQFVIAAVNTLLTFIFLLILGLPYIPFLTLSTFIFGMLPMVGGVISNTVIVGTALTVSPEHAILSFGFLVFMHKAEYFLNSRIVGSSLRYPMWATLLGILIGEVVMGVAGIILAPTLIYYAREELQAIKTRD